MPHDLRFAVRQLARRPWFSAAVAVTLALGIGINTTVFTLVNAALFKPVPLPGGDRLVTVMQERISDPGHMQAVSLPDFRDYREQNHCFADLEAAGQNQGVLSEENNPPERFNLGTVSSGMFDMLRTPPVLGRGFSSADDRPGAAPVLLIGYDVWQKRYGGARDVIGRSVHLDGKPTVIVGVMPPGFKFPNNEEIWRPLVPTAEREKRGRRSLMLFGLLKPGLSQSDAQGDLTVISSRLARAYPKTNRDLTALVQTFQQTFNGGPIKLVFLVMLGAVGFVLLIACANVANLMLSRALGRSREIAVRAAIGASRWQIVRQLLTESILLSSLGGVLGLGLSTFGVRAFDNATQNVGKPFWVQFTMDWRVFAYFAAISVLSGIAFGLLPAWRASRVDLNSALKNGTAGGTFRGGRLTGALVALQFALTVVLLAGAGLMMRSFLTLQRINPFVPAAHLFTARISLPDGKGERYETPESRIRMHDRLEARLAALPGVDQAVLASDFPGLGSQTRDIEIEGRPAPNPKQPPRVAPIFATPNYLATINLPLLGGRALRDPDGETGHEAAVVTRAFAVRYWPGELPIGQRFRFLNDGKPGAWITIVGVCGDIVQDPQSPNPPPVVYLSDRQEPWAWLGLMLRTPGDPAALASSVRAAVQAIDPTLPLFEVQSLPHAIEHNNWFLKVFGSLFLTFALIALTMASVGIYAVVAQSTARRTREIGIRMALGATAGSVVRLVLSRGLRQLAIGLVIGLGGALAVSQLMVHLIGAESPRDPVVFGAVTGLLVSIGLFACWLPARRAAYVQPTEALRSE
ncbi:MAG TPA: ABC transporter permease [Opitutaceae bacterium]|nr:ABC transporter permease [Opitutaceae bacterium]